MGSVNHDLKVIYIHNPKTGGSFIDHLLCEYYGFKLFRLTIDKHDEFNDDINKFKKKDISHCGLFNLRKKGLVRYIQEGKKEDYIYELTSVKDIEKLFKQRIIKNIPKDEAELLEKMWDTYYKFTFVRNPYDRFISSWKHCIKNKCDFQENNIINYNLLNEFIKNRDNLKDNEYWHTFITQYDNLVNKDNLLDFNYIGKFENFNKEFIDILFKIGIKKIYHVDFIKNNVKLNNDFYHENYCYFYTNKLIKFVNEFFKNDFLNFDYKICNNIDDLEKESKNFFLSKTNFNIKNMELIKYIEEKEYEISLHNL